MLLALKPGPEFIIQTASAAAESGPAAAINILLDAAEASPIKFQPNAIGLLAAAKRELTDIVIRILDMDGLGRRKDHLISALSVAADHDQMNTFHALLEPRAKWPRMKPHDLPKSAADLMTAAIDEKALRTRLSPRRPGPKTKPSPRM